MKASSFRDMTQDELLIKLKELQEALFNLKFQHVTGQLENNRPVDKEQERYS